MRVSIALRTVAAYQCAPPCAVGTPSDSSAAPILDETGLRLGELQTLMWGDLDFRDGRLRIARNRTKGGTGGRRSVPLPSALLVEIADMVPLRTTTSPQSCRPASRRRVFGTR